MSPEAAQTIATMLAQFPPRQDQLLPMLHEMQRQFGSVLREALPVIAGHFNVSHAEVHGVVSFYDDFHVAETDAEPAAFALVVQVCMAEACQAVGARALAAHVERALGVKVGATRADGQVRLERRYCFGNCACGPSVRIGDDVFGRVDGARIDQLLAQASSPSTPPAKDSAA